MTRRKRQLREAPHPRLEIVPMIDIMMFLLIFFVLFALRMIPDSGVAMELPGAASAAQLPPTQVVIAIDGNGIAHLQDQQLTVDEIGARLRARLPRERTSVVIAADKSIRFEQVMAVMDAVRQAGINNVGLAAKRE